MSNGNWTLFAPNDNAFERLELEYGGLQAFIERGNNSLLEVLRFHAVDGKKLYANDLKCDVGDSLITMANGKPTRTKCDPFGQKGGKNNDPAIFNEIDIEACNGIIHIIEDVLLYN